MRKLALSAIVLGLICLKIEAQTMSFASASSVIFNTKSPPTDWFGTPQEREIAAALLKVAPQLAQEKNRARREFAQNQVARGLARLGRETQARRLAKTPATFQQISYFAATRAILAGREKQAIARLPQLSEAQKVAVQILLGNAFFAWRGDKISARKWLLAARQTLLQSSRLAESGTLQELKIARDLAAVGAVEDAKTIFADLDQKWRGGDSQDIFNVVYRAWIFEARLRNGLENEALEMLSDRELFPLGITYLFAAKKEALALQLLEKEPPIAAFEILHASTRLSLAKKELRNRTAFHAMRAAWNRLSSAQKNDVYQAGNMAVAIAFFDSPRAAFDFVALNLSGETALHVQRKLKVEILADAQLQRQTQAKILQIWRDEKLKIEEERALKFTKGRRYPDSWGHEEGSWIDVYDAAVEAKNWKKARLALEKSEQIAARGENRDAANHLITRYRAWNGLGEPKRAALNLKKFKQHVAQFKHSPDAIYSPDIIKFDQPLTREFLKTRPPRDLNVAFQIFERQNFLDSKTAIPRWILEIPDAPTRAVGLANRAATFYPLGNVRIGVE